MKLLEIINGLMLIILLNHSVLPESRKKMFPIRCKKDKKSISLTFSKNQE